jgi:hypothetical protein
MISPLLSPSSLVLFPSPLLENPERMLIALAGPENQGAFSEGSSKGADIKRKRKRKMKSKIKKRIKRKSKRKSMIN